MTHVLDSQYHSDERLKLFSNLKTTIERIVSQHSTDILYVHGGVTSLVKSFDAIFRHGIKPSTKFNQVDVADVEDYWLFVETLQWLNPSFAFDIENLKKFAFSDSTHGTSNKTKSPTSYHVRRRSKSRGQLWLEKSIKMKNLSTQIKCLLAGGSSVSQHYYDWAFLRDAKFVSATLICLEALEHNSATLLADVPVDLFGKLEDACSDRKFVRVHSTDTSIVENPVVPNEAELFPSNKPSSQDIVDPLCGSLQPTKVFPLHRTSGNHYATSEASTAADDQLLLVNNMGSVASAASCLGGCSSNLDLTADNISATYQLLQTNDNLPFYSKPLFNDDSSEDFNDDLGFLLGVTNSSQMTVESPHIYHVSESDEIAPNSRHFPETRSEQHQLSALPDVVVSAEESFLSQPITKHFSIPPTNPDQFDDMLLPVSMNVSNNAQQTNTKLKFSSEIDNSLKQNSVQTHRRSRSDHIKGQKIFSSDEATQNILLNTSSSFPSLCDIDGNSESQDYRNENTPKTRSLMTFLQNQDLTTCADIDKENAHFHFSEMLIGAIEQVKCQVKNKTENNQAMQVAANNFLIGAEFGQPPAATLTPPVYVGTTSSVVTSPSCGYSSPFGSITSDDDLSHSVSSSNLALLPNTPHSTTVSDLSSPIPSETSLPQSSSLNKLLRMDSFRTAESIAIGLLKTFSGQRRVTASEVKWLISEEDVPQKLLPMPSSTSIDPDVATSNDASLDSSVRIRGNQDWAPPRPQIIFHTPVRLKLKVAMVKQNYRCAGCGTLVNKAYMKRFRYCEYVGKYFCSCCHDNKLSVIPANILHKFDFTRYKVSNFSYDLIQGISSDPLFNLNDINSNIYKKVKSLSSILALRKQMLPLFKYIQACRLATSAVSDDESNTQTLKAQIPGLVPQYMLDGDVHLYSLDGLIEVKSGTMLHNVKEAVSMATNHLNQCELCQMKGFICEYCKDHSHIIFPHQQNTTTCEVCHSCYHTKCFNPLSCPKCKRISKRKELLRRKELV
uniref:Uncharacterized protein LOC100181521 n=1 Tax=Phallusia mammillata TaxID=59560 RepID=A0A6F9DID5_9ASCI|nr:uncharacterized protein LOC100181521 [Phallusia mammillata]